MRGDAAQALADGFNARDSIPAMLELMKPNCPAYELHTYVEALAMFCDGVEEPALASVTSMVKAVPVIDSLLKHNDEEYRQEAVYVLGQIGPQANAALPHLRAALLAAEKEEENCRRERRDIPRLGKQERTLREEINHALQLIAGCK